MVRPCLEFAQLRSSKTKNFTPEDSAAYISGFLRPAPSREGQVLERLTTGIRRPRERFCDASTQSMVYLEQPGAPFLDDWFWNPAMG